MGSLSRISTNLDILVAWVVASVERGTDQDRSGDGMKKTRPRAFRGRRYDCDHKTSVSGVRRQTHDNSQNSAEKSNTYVRSHTTAHANICNASTRQSGSVRACAAAAQPCILRLARLEMQTRAPDPDHLITDLRQRRCEPARRGVSSRPA